MLNEEVHIASNDIIKRLDPSRLKTESAFNEENELGDISNHLLIIFERYLADPDILKDFPAQPPTKLSPKKAKQAFSEVGDAEFAIKESENAVEVFYKRWSEKLGIPLNQELLHQQISLSQLENIFPGIVDVLPMLFLENENTYLKSLLLALKETTRVENSIGPRARKAIKEFATRHPELPVVKTNLSLEEYSVGGNPNAEVQLGDGFNLSFLDASGVYRAVIKLKLEKQLVDFLSSNQELPYKVKYFSEQDVDPKYYPYLLEVIFVHEYAHGIINKIVGEETAINYLATTQENLTNCISEGFTVSAEITYAHEKYKEAIDRKDTLAAEAFLFAIRARKNAFKENKNRYYYGRRVLAQAWINSGRSLEELFQLLPQIDFEKTSQIFIDTPEFTEFAKDPLNSVPLKNSGSSHN